MHRIHIVGRKNHGKTTLLVELIREYCRRGVRVGSIKHSSHEHELDTPGKDSYRHGVAGASPSAIITPRQVGLYLTRPADASVYDRLKSAFSDCAIVLVEGDADAPATKVEVWRAELGSVPLATERSDVRAVISNDQPAVPVPVWPRCPIVELADRLLDLVGGIDASSRIRSG